MVSGLIRFSADKGLTTPRSFEARLMGSCRIFHNIPLHHTYGQIYYQESPTDATDGVHGVSQFFHRSSCRGLAHSGPARV